MIGLILVVVASLWLCLAQAFISTMPLALASEAPDRHLPKKESFTKTECYELASALARDIRDSSPNILLPTALFLLAAWLLHGSREPQTPTHSNDNSRNA